MEIIKLLIKDYNKMKDTSWQSLLKFFTKWLMIVFIIWLMIHQLGLEITIKP